MLTGSGSLDCCIKCQQIGLVSNTGNSIDNFANFLGTNPQLSYSFSWLVNGISNLIHLANSPVNSSLTPFSGLTGVGRSLTHTLGTGSNRSNIFSHIANLIHNIDHGIILLLSCTGNITYLACNMGNGLSTLLGAFRQITGGSRYLLGTVLNLLQQVL